MFERLKRMLIGEKLKTEELNGEKFNVFWGLPVLSSDAISSVAYAGEEILWVLVPILGLAAYKSMFYVALAIVGLLFILVFSYRQTIDSYPNGGGSFIVARENLGTIPGLTAGAALSIDYILTVAVSTSAGTAALTSAVPALLPYKAIITVIFILVLTVGNLRGVKDSSRLFGIPTYFFLISMFFMLIVGVIKVLVLKESPQAAMEIPKAAGDFTMFVVLRAFAAGCTALTGVEAVSDGIPNFEQPAQKNAKKVLSLLAFVVLIIFGGTSYLATLYHAVPNHEVTVVAQIATQVFAGNLKFMFYVIQATTAIILIMAANTAFSDFPILMSLMGRDGFVPRQFSQRGERLNFANGIKLLSAAACILVFIFNGETHALLPLYAVGVFTSFTLSQTGMFIRWNREKVEGWKHKAVINGFGAIITFVTAIIIGTTKFKSGAWLVCILIPVIVCVMLMVKAHYCRIAQELSLTVKRSKCLASKEDPIEHVIVLVDNLNQASLKAINYAKRLSENIVAFHIAVDETTSEKLKQKWKENNIEIPLIVKTSPYREIIRPLEEFIESEEHASQPGDMVTIVMPEFVVTKWWQRLLHNQTAHLIRQKLLKDRHIAVVSVPYVIN